MSFRKRQGLNLQVYNTPPVSFQHWSKWSFCGLPNFVILLWAKHSIVSLLTSDWRSFRTEPKPVKITPQTHEVVYTNITANIHIFKNKRMYLLGIASCMTIFRNYFAKTLLCLYLNPSMQMSLDRCTIWCKSHNCMVSTGHSVCGYDHSRLEALFRTNGKFRKLPVGQKR